MIEETVDFGLIRYANCWEDADVLLEALQVDEKSRVLSIASGGDNSLALLSRGASVVAADLSAVQLALVELKLAAFRTLTYDELLKFLGVYPEPSREILYRKVRPQLSDRTRGYWDANASILSNGVIHCGKFERYFAFFRKRILPLIHSPARIERLHENKSADEQIQFYETRWNNLRWKLFFALFFNRFTMGKYGRDPEFLRHVEVGVSKFIYSKAQTHLKSTACQDNAFLSMIHRGHFGSTLPYYLRAENYAAIREYAGSKTNSKLTLVRSSIDELIESEQKWTHLNLSDIFEYQSQKDFEITCKKYARHLDSGTRLFFWNLMCPRSFSETANQDFQRLENPNRVDRGFFYLRSLLEQRK